MENMHDAFNITSAESSYFIYHLIGNYDLKTAFLLTHPNYPKHLMTSKLHRLIKKTEKFANKTCTPQNNWSVFDCIYYEVEFAYLMGAKDKIMPIIQGDYQTLVVRPYQKMSAVFDVETTLKIMGQFYYWANKWALLANRVEDELAKALIPVSREAILTINREHTGLHYLLPSRLLEQKLNNVFDMKGEY